MRPAKLKPATESIRHQIDFHHCLIRACRLSGINMSEASEKAGMCRSWMRGAAQRNNPSLETIRRCAAVFNMSDIELLTIAKR